MSNSQLLRSSLKLRDQHTFCLFFHRKVSERAILRETAKSNQNKYSGYDFFRKFQRISRILNLGKMAASFEDLNKTVTDMRNDLNCQICGTTPRPGKTQWFRCLKLHQICQDCQSKNEKCSCGEPISKEHCKIIEKLLSTKRMKLNCKNTKNGCRQVLADFALEDHESECFYREIQFSAAKNTIFKDFVGEVIPKYPEVQHPISRYQQSVQKDNDVYSAILRFQFAMKTFLFMQSFTKEKLIICAKVYIVGSPEEAKHFSFNLKYFGPKSYTTFGGQVMSVDETIDSVMKT